MYSVKFKELMEHNIYLIEGIIFKDNKEVFKTTAFSLEGAKLAIKAKLLNFNFKENVSPQVLNYKDLEKRYWKILNRQNRPFTTIWVK